MCLHVYGCVGVHTRMLCVCVSAVCVWVCVQFVCVVQFVCGCACECVYVSSFCVWGVWVCVRERPMNE